MRDNHFPHLLLGRKLRYNRNQRIRESIGDQAGFNELFRLTFHPEALVAQRAMRAVMMVTKEHPEFLQAHAELLLTLLKSPDHKEIRSMVIQLIPKVNLDPDQLERVWNLLRYHVLNQNEQKTIRVHALQGLYALAHQQATFAHELADTLDALTHDLTPSIQAKVMKLRGLLRKAVKVNA
jgi:uncharacterized protein YigA (DUF484 family)